MNPPKIERVRTRETGYVIITRSKLINHRRLGTNGTRWILMIFCFLVAQIMAIDATESQEPSESGLASETTSRPSSLEVRLSGEHVCQEEESYRVNVTEYFLRNVTVRSFKWCMQVPPRCSTFAHRTINESRVIEEERTRRINVCCDGYEPDSDGKKCAPSCDRKCAHGECSKELKCYCSPGYRGEYCDTECDADRWGRYCRYHCECLRGRCDRVSGFCECPPGWIGLRCEKQCPSGTFGRKCERSCACRADQICDFQDGRCSNRVKLAVLKKYHTFDAPASTQKAHVAKKVDMYLLTTEPNSLAIANEKDAKISNIFKISNARTPSSLITTTITVHESLAANDFERVDNARSAEPRAGVNIKSMDRKAMKSDASAKGKVDHEVVEFADAAGADLPENATKMSSYPSRPDEGSPQARDALTIGFLCVVVVAGSGFLLAARLIKQKENASGPKTSSAHRKQTPTSIFHTPLPEPPQSPFFNSGGGDGDEHYVQPRLSFASMTRISNNMTLADEINESEELADGLYDQLPSTGGTYKATAAPEPPPMPPPPPSQDAPAENLYDEIPCWTRSTDNDALYINTRIENKTQF